MARTATHLATPYSAYNRGRVSEDDRETAQVGRGTPCGEYLRRFWHPVAMASELGDLPLAVRVLGEDLVLFRDKKGRVGLLEKHCTHRGTSLEYAQIEEAGIRCCYHGWLYEVSGKILETPTEPPDSTFKDRLCHGAYPVIERLGLIFAYMGPPELRPEVPVYDAFLKKDHDWFVGRDYYPCNWLQIMDNGADPAHTAFLHTIGLGTRNGMATYTDAFREVGALDYAETPIGTVYIMTRRIGENVFVRMKDEILPNIQYGAPHVYKDETEGYGIEDGKRVHGFAWLRGPFTWVLPVDDTHSSSFHVNHFQHGTEDPDALRANFAKTVLRNMSDGRPYQERQRFPGDWEAAVSQRPIANHTLEHLGAADRCVIAFRRKVDEGIKAVREGKDPVGVVRTPGQVITTHGSNTVIHCPPAATPDEDLHLLRQVGKKIALGYIKKPETQGKRLSPIAALDGGGRV